MDKKYAAIAGVPHHVSRVHPQMSMEDRAAQFSPFAALTGYGDVILETQRLTDEKVELDEEAKNRATPIPCTTCGQRTKAKSTSGENRVRR